jgi:hypothetical protein
MDMEKAVLLPFQPIVTTAHDCGLRQALQLFLHRFGKLFNERNPVK